jgi:hypothetical protein
MAAKKPGKLWFKFTLFGLPWEARIAPAKCKALDYGKTFAYCMFDARLIVLGDGLTQEQQRTTFAHELQHAIEEHADVDYETKVSDDVADRCTDQVARGWLYVIRHCPEIINFLRGEHEAKTL